MHILLIPVLVYVQICTIASAWRHPFPFQPKGSSGTQATSQEHLRSALVSPSEKTAMDHGIQTFLALKAKEPSCFKAAVLTLKDGCEALSVSQDTKIKYALMLTVCELSTANVPIPPECNSIDDGTDARAQQCVMKLASTPQTWTSYSGYFRDVVSMCFAIRYPIEKDMLEKLRKDIADNQLQNYDLLRDQRAQLVNWHQEEIENFKIIRSAQQSLKEQLEAMENSRHRASKGVQDLTGSIMSLQHNTESALKAQEELVNLVADTSQRQFEQTVFDMEAMLESAFFQVEARLGQLNTALSHSLLIQNKSHEAWHQMQIIQWELSYNWNNSVSHMNNSLLQMFDDTEKQVHYLQQEIGTIHGQILVIINPIRQLVQFMTEWAVTKTTFMRVLEIIWIVIGYLMSGSNGKSVKYLLLTMIGSLLRKQLNILSMGNSLVFFALPLLRHVIRWKRCKNRLNYPTQMPDHRESSQQSFKSEKLDRLNLYYELINYD
ncbi:hypothetical protein CLU79DRAFT_842248 [Phycomyces nitens]|nr:hypothetical protein CLU79DRAFT_842248 [Phycomyces nitens]